MDSPLSRSPGSRVLIGVGLPITRASSPLGGPHRLEYWGTPPHRRSPPLALPPPPPPLPHWPIEWDCAAPIRFWLGPGLACQLVVFAPSDWPCAKKRFTSSSPANSARMVVFPRTHLKNTNGESTGLIKITWKDVMQSFLDYRNNIWKKKKSHLVIIFYVKLQHEGMTVTSGSMWLLRDKNNFCSHPDTLTKRKINFNEVEFIGGLMHQKQEEEMKRCWGLTCAETFGPLQLHLWSCSAPQRFPGSSWGGMWSGGRAACTGSAE